MKKYALLSLLLLSSPVFATVGTIVSGQSLWWIVKRIGQTSDLIESKLDLLAGCSVTPLSSADISAGTITISSAGNYRLSEDVTANIGITASCVFLDLNNRRVVGNVQQGVSSLEDVEITNGVVVGLVSSNAFSKRFAVTNVSVWPTVAGVSGITLATSDDAQIVGCTVKTADVAGVSGGNAGHGIAVQAGSGNVIRDCIIQSGAGGDHAAGAGGDGGHGISVSSASANVEIDRCLIMATGDGGIGDSDAGGDGGHGIRITSDCTKIAVHDCVIRKTGSGGIGNTANGADGKAVDDDVTLSGSESVFLRNFAHKISNQIKYDLQATNTEQGTVIGQPSGNFDLPDSNQFVNAYMTDT